MSHTVMGDQRRGGRGTFHGRRRWRMRPTLLELEARTLLSTIVVNNPTDTPVAGKTDLRQAIVQANTNGGAETITFDKTVFNTPQTIHLDPALGQLELNDPTGTETITGPNAGELAISGNAASRLFEIGSGAKVAISGLTLTDGVATDGAGVLNAGNLTLTQDVLSADVAQGVAGGGLFGDGAGRGGGVENEAGATLTVSQSTFTGDLALGGTGGGNARRALRHSPGNGQRPTTVLERRADPREAVDVAQAHAQVGAETPASDALGSGGLARGLDRAGRQHRLDHARPGRATSRVDRPPPVRRGRIAATSEGR